MIFWQNSQSRSWFTVLFFCPVTRLATAAIPTINLVIALFSNRIAPHPVTMGKTPVPEADTSTLITHLRSVLPKDGTREVLITSVIPTLLQSITGVAEALRASCHVAADGTANTFGDDRTF